MEIRFFADQGKFDSGHIGEIADVFCGQVLAVAGMVGAAGQIQAEQPVFISG